MHSFIRLPTDNRKKLSPYVISPVQKRKESSGYLRHKTPSDMTFDSPKPLKEYKVADTRQLLSRSIYTNYLYIGTEKKNWVWVMNSNSIMTKNE